MTVVRLRWVSIVLLSVSLLLPGLASAAIASSDVGTQPDSARLAFGLSPTLSGDPVENEFGLAVSADELARLRRAEEVIERGKELATNLDKVPNEYGGVWFDRTTDTFVVHLVDSSPKTRESAETFPLGGSISVQNVKYSLDELNAAQAELAGLLDADDWATIGVDVPTNAVVVGLLPTATAAAYDILEPYGDAVKVTRGELVGITDCTARTDCHPPLRGGLDIWRASDSAHCTAGFVYQSASHVFGTKGKVLTTAGHCGPSGAVGGAWRHGNPAETIGSVYQNANVSGTSADVMFIDISDTWGSNDVFKEWLASSPSIVNITSRGCPNEVGGTGCEVVGETVCYTGRQTGYKCGTLSQINVSATDINGVTKHHNRTVTPNSSSGGDSGAPAFLASKAKGHLWGGTSSAWYYSHIHYVQEYCSYTTTCRVQILP